MDEYGDIEAERDVRIALEGAEAERAAVVAWLRTQNSHAVFLADAIESRQHLSGDRKR